MELVGALCREFNKTFVIVTHDPKGRTAAIVPSTRGQLAPR
jgi:hypothetical protein